MNQENINEVSTLVRSGKIAPAVEYIRVCPQLLTSADEFGVPLAHLFALVGELGSLGKILKQNALETLWGPNWTVAHVAAATGCLKALEQPLAKARHLLYWPDAWGNSPVHIAARHGNVYQIAHLLQTSHLVQRNRLFSTPVHVAAMNHHLDQIASKLTPSLLILLDLSGESALSVAKRSGSASQLPEELVWETEFLSDPSKRTLKSVLQHAGLNP